MSYLPSFLTRGWSSVSSEMLAGEVESGEAHDDPSNGGSVPWLRVREQDKLEVIDTATALLQAKGTTPANLIAILGAARQGKSFLMNTLAGEDNLFKISNQKDPCTCGVDLSRRMIPWSIFGGKGSGEVKKASRSDPLVGFVDCEGQGDRDVGYDANLVTPPLLVSKCVIFNWKDSLQRDRILNLLAVLQRAAYQVAVEEAEEDTLEAKIFGHLHIVFRDWHYEGSVQDVYKTLFAPERSTAQDAVARNTLRQVLQLSFQSISVWLLPSPVEKTAELSKELSKGNLSASFVHETNKLKAALVEQLVAPHTFNRRALTAAKIAALTPNIAETLNAGKQIMPRSAYASLLETERQQVGSRMQQKVEEATAIINKQAEGVAMTTEAAKAALAEKLDGIRMELDRWLKTVNEDDVREGAVRDFVERCYKAMAEIAEANIKQHLPHHLRQGLQEAKKSFEDAFVSAIKLPCTIAAMVRAEAKARYNAELLLSRVVAGEPMSDTLLREPLGQLREYCELNLLKVENENKQKVSAVEAQDQRAIGEAIKVLEAELTSAVAAPKAKGISSESAFAGAQEAALKKAQSLLSKHMSQELTTSSQREAVTHLLGVLAGCMLKELRNRQQVARLAAEMKELQDAAMADGEELDRQKERTRTLEAQGAANRRTKETEVEILRAQVAALQSEKESGGQHKDRLALAEEHVRTLRALQSEERTAMANSNAQIQVLQRQLATQEREVAATKTEFEEEQAKSRLLEAQILTLRQQAQAAEEQLELLGRKRRAEEINAAGEPADQEDKKVNAEPEPPQKKPARKSASRNVQKRGAEAEADHLSPSKLEQAREEERKRIDTHARQRIVRGQKSHQG